MHTCTPCSECTHLHSEWPKGNYNYHIIDLCLEQTPFKCTYGVRVAGKDGNTHTHTHMHVFRVCPILLLRTEQKLHASTIIALIHHNAEKAKLTCTTVPGRRPITLCQRDWALMRLHSSQTSLSEAKKTNRSKMCRVRH